MNRADEPEERQRPDTLSDSERHPDDLELMLIADGEAVGSDVASHHAACAACASRVESLRRETTSLASGFALDGAELDALRGAALPERVAERVHRDAEASRLLRREGVIGLLWAMAGIGLIYAGLWVASPAFWTGIDAARRVGAGSVVARALFAVAISAGQTAFLVLDSIRHLPGIDAPWLPVAALALVGWLALFVAQHAPKLARRRATV